MNKSIPTLNRRDFLRLGTVLTGGLFVLPLLRTLEPHPTAFRGRLLKDGVSRTGPLAPALPPNPLLKKLGFKDTDKVVIIELQDLGLCEANLSAFYELVASGLVTSGIALVPSAWFPQVAHFARIHPGLDLGINLILVSEWSAMRWRALSSVDPATGLLDVRGYFPMDGVPSTGSDLKAISQELLAQIKRAQRMGLRPTHLAVHELYKLSPAFIPLYFQAAQEARLPLVFLRPDEAQWSALPGIHAEWLSAGMEASTQLAGQGAPLLDSLIDLSSSAPEERLALTKQALDSLGGGVHLISLHAAKDTPELRALTPDWKKYVADYQTWTSQETAKHLKASGIQIIHWKNILEA